MTRGIRNDFPYGIMSGRTASALEMRGLAERRYTGADDSQIYITGKGAALSDTWYQDDPEHDPEGEAASEEPTRDPAVLALWRSRNANTLDTSEAVTGSPAVVATVSARGEEATP